MQVMNRSKEKKNRGLNFKKGVSVCLAKKKRRKENKED